MQNLMKAGQGASAISKHTGLSRQAIIRIRDEPEIVASALIQWGL
ncbi:MAG: hypothetical protein JKY99_12680 [Rhizobiales bacterium]|nr:hypothetical protein [Hyphomicrobiales bacterium]